ncbi:MAG: hypothetical protein KC549_17165 [Myxococcales bacterium]|nr:hypothetical protein [Myxococcales bacterium]MCB9547373.1 hypothetical protein [Myxococcales bacterium]
MRRGLVALAILAVGAVVTLDPTGAAGDRAVPVPIPSVPLGDGVYLAVGRRDVGRFLAEAAPAAVEQLGSGAVLRLPAGELHVTWRIVASVFTWVAYRWASPAPPR